MALILGIYQEIRLKLALLVLTGTFPAILRGKVRGGVNGRAARRCGQDQLALHATGNRGGPEARQSLYQPLPPRVFGVHSSEPQAAMVSSTASSRWRPLPCSIAPRIMADCSALPCCIACSSGRVGLPSFRSSPTFYPTAHRLNCSQADRQSAGKRCPDSARSPVTLSLVPRCSRPGSRSTGLRLQTNERSCYK
ncbi:Uncharacterised protein [Klebsiella grimontii]|uniref:Uncharacterized protein n=1 Tax=Klebsiella grimontii TaxID=2058152 RepID=A0A7H4NVY1_9ENTR|nr:Uncharacterised protein [Klebsiella grimontii]